MIESFAGAFAPTLGLLGIVILLAALASGAIERSGFPQVALFLGLGLLIGPAGLGLLHFELHSPALHAVATVALLLVLFIDAVVLNLTEVRTHARLALIALGPGTLIPAIVTTVAGVVLLDLSLPLAAVLGAALAST